LHRWPTEQELADRIGVPLGEVRDAQRAFGCFHSVSLDAPVRAGSTLSLGSPVPARENTFELVNQLETLRSAVENLAARDKLILRRRMIDHWGQAEIAAEIGVSQMQVWRLLRRIMKVLQAALADDSRHRLRGTDCSR
jgi:RNA polymerase sigma-B factor